MTENEWLNKPDPREMIEFLRDKVGPRKPRLFAVACSRKVWDDNYDVRSWRAVAAAEAFADGLNSPQELAAAHELAVAAVDDVLDLPQWSEDHAVAAADCAMEDAISAAWQAIIYAIVNTLEDTQNLHVTYLRDIFGNPFHPVVLHSTWRTSTVTALAQTIYTERAYDRLPILADALEDAGCTNAEVLAHCRQPLEHVRGCWVVDLLLGKV